MESTRESTAVGRREAVAAMLDRHWSAAGYAAPNGTVYPWQWLWDSCFHAIIWAELGDERALVELASALSTQDPSGFVPHMNYVLDPPAHADLWGRSGASSITQPPMYGHAIAELTARGMPVPEATVDAAAAGLGFLLRRRARDTDSELVLLCHPWESGCDDSPRWDDVCPGGSFELTRWRQFKSELVGAIDRGPHGEPLASAGFRVASIGFNALVAFNAHELAALTGDAVLAAEADALAEAVAARFDAERATWVDAGDTAAGSGRTRTLDGLLGLLVSTDAAQQEAAAASLVDPSAHGAAYGPTGVHRAEAAFAPEVYWRGPAWPQLAYLCWVALRRAGRPEAAPVGTALIEGAARSGWAEYWHPDTGAGLGAIPQSWTGLAIVVEAAGQGTSREGTSR